MNDNDTLSLKANDEEIEIKANKSDYIAALVRGIVGAAPGIGSMAAELITSQIPNQKLDRVILFIRVLEDKLKYVEEDVLKQKFKSEEFSDLLEDALAQATKALTDERRKYIANLLKNSITSEELDHIGKKKLLSLLNELNDPEIMLLHYYSLQNQKEAFDTLDNNSFIQTVLNASAYEQPQVEEEILYGSYRGKLVMENLIMGTGGLSEKPSALGSLLLRFIEPHAH